MEVGVFQFAPLLGRPAANRERILRALAEAPGPPDLVVLPELSLTGYLLPDRAAVRRLAEPVPGPTTDALTDLTRRRGVHVLVGLAERAGDEVFNSAVLVGPEGPVGVYRKVHLFGREPELFTPGAEPWPVVRVGEVPVGILICFDWIFPEAARTLALRGARLLALPANLVLPYAHEAIRTRALENRVFCVLANRVGREEAEGCEPLTFRGGSRLVGPEGEVLLDLGGEEALAGAAIAPELAARKVLPGAGDLFRMRRPELYGALTERGR